MYEREGRAMMCFGRWVFVNSEQLTTFQITLPQEDIVAIDTAVERFEALEDREDFIFLAIRYAIASISEEPEMLMLGLEGQINTDPKGPSGKSSDGLFRFG
jgi:hypothetical protein